MNRAKTLEWTALVYPQDFSPDGSAVGPETIHRLEQLVQARKGGRYRITKVVLACGLGPRDEAPLQRRPFSELMLDWLIQEGSFSSDEIVCSPNLQAWNCIEVTVETIKIVVRRGLSRNILVISPHLHIYPRLWITWKLLLLRSRWKLKYLSVPKAHTDPVHECLGTVKYIPMALWYRFKYRRLIR